MSIHREHPFADAPRDRDPVRRFRGRLPAPVTLWTAGSGEGRVGLTVSSLILAEGDPPAVAGLIDEDSTFADDLPDRFVVQVLAPGQEYLAEAFAGLAPSPGGPFRLGTWEETPWGPLLAGSAGHLGVRRQASPPDHLGWPLLVTGLVEHVELSDLGSLRHQRGRYLTD